MKDKKRMEDKKRQERGQALLSIGLVFIALLVATISSANLAQAEEFVHGILIEVDGKEYYWAGAPDGPDGATDIPGHDWVQTGANELVGKHLNIGPFGAPQWWSSDAPDGELLYLAHVIIDIWSPDKAEEYALRGYVHYHELVGVSDGKLHPTKVGWFKHTAVTSFILDGGPHPEASHAVTLGIDYEFINNYAMPYIPAEEDEFVHGITIDVDGEEYYWAGAPDGPDGATDIPGHDWIQTGPDELVGKHFNTGPFDAPQWWSSDAPDGALLYLAHVIIDTWSLAKAEAYAAKGYVHYHELVRVSDGELHPTKIGWFKHTAVTSFTLDGGPHPEASHAVISGIDYEFINNYTVPYIAQAEEEFVHGITIDVDGEGYYWAGAPDGPDGATDIPGHDWVQTGPDELVGKHLNTGPFDAPQWWASDAPDGELLYLAHVIIDTWSPDKAEEYASRGYVHYHELVGVSDGELHPTKVGWFKHTAVTSFTLDGGPHPEASHAVIPGIDREFINNYTKPYIPAEQDEFVHGIVIDVDGEEYYWAGAPDGPDDATDIPGHDWVQTGPDELVGKHFNTGPFDAPQWWSSDAPDGALLYLAHVIIDTWSLAKAEAYAAKGYVHYHEFVRVADGELHPTLVGWFKHTAVTNFTLDGGPHPEASHAVTPGIDYEFINNYTVLYPAVHEPEPTPEDEPAGGFIRDFSNVFFLNLSAGLNMISLPLEPIEPFTARGLAEELDSTVVIKFDPERQRFVGFTPDSEGDGFAIEGGKGYIINRLTSGVVTFVGAAWVNEPPVEAAPLVMERNDAWAFVLSGKLDEKSASSKTSASSGAYMVTVTNLRTGAVATDSIDPFADETFAAVFADLNRNPVVESGDVVEIVVRDGAGKVISGPVTRRIGVDDIRKAFANVTVFFGHITPEKSVLLQNYPNPFNPETWIPYQLAEKAEVSVKIYDTSGKLVRSLSLGDKEAGIYTQKNESAYWDGRSDTGERVSSGVYFYTIHAESFIATRRMLIVK